MSTSSGILALIAFAATLAAVLGISLLAEKWLEERLARDEQVLPRPTPRERPLLRLVKRDTAGRHKAA
jgi:hypothetical protein